MCMNFMFQAAFLLSWWHLQEQMDNDDCKRCKVASQDLEITNYVEYFKITYKASRKDSQFRKSFKQCCI